MYSETVTTSYYECRDDGSASVSACAREYRNVAIQHWRQVAHRPAAPTSE